LLAGNAQQLTADQERCRNRGWCSRWTCTKAARPRSSRTAYRHTTAPWPTSIGAIAYAGKKENDRAIDDFTAAIKVNPNFAAAYNNRGSAVQAKGDYDRAITDYSEAIRIDPNYAVAYSDRGNLFEAQVGREGAIADFLRALNRPEP
jgi:tetratricopeptide (TPR) repeat protein